MTVQWPARFGGDKMGECPILPRGDPFVSPVRFSCPVPPRCSWRRWPQARRTVLRPRPRRAGRRTPRSEEHTSELQTLMRLSYAVFCLKKKNNTTNKSLLFNPPLLTTYINLTYI